MTIVTTEEYEQFVDEFCTYRDPLYPFLGLAGEAGEVLEQVKKAWRDKQMDFLACDERVFNMVDEMGDVLWYLVRCAHVCGVDLPTLMDNNMEKLRERRAEKV